MSPYATKLSQVETCLDRAQRLLITETLATTYAELVDMPQAGAQVIQMAEMARPLFQRTADEYRWLMEELRVSLFAQELRTPQPVSGKRLDKAWAQLSG